MYLLGTTIHLSPNARRPLRPRLRRNGITYSEIASRILTDTIQGRPHPDADLFAFGRS